MTKKKDIESIHYLSPLQEGLLFHAVSDTAADPYFTQTGFVIDGELDLDPFEQAWQKVMERHPILRTGFVWDSVKQPMQVARRSVRIPLQILDWRAHHSRQRDEALERFLSDDRRKPFDLLTPPMMRLTLIRIEDNRWYFINSHHHILLDGWSVALLLREVLICYDALARGDSRASARETVCRVPDVVADQELGICRNVLANRPGGIRDADRTAAGEAATRGFRRIEIPPVRGAGSATVEGRR